MEASPEQLKEYEKQLADVKELLEASPEDESLRSLKSDLEELVALTRDSLGASEDNSKVDSSKQKSEATIHVAGTVASVDSIAVTAAKNKAAANFDCDLPPVASVPNTSDAAAAPEPPKKKQKAIKEFEVPAHLVVLETDSEADKNKKRRTLKALKNKWRQEKKTAETNKKQKSWQSFQSKKKLKNDKSIFSTHTDDAKVGVTSSRRKTEFAGRQKHKH